MRQSPLTPAQIENARMRYVSTQRDGPAIRVRPKTGDAVAWVWTQPSGRHCAVVFYGRSIKPASNCGPFSFRTPENRARWVAEKFAAAQRRSDDQARRAAERREKSAQPHQLVVGDVLESVWGYEQTNVDYFEVTAVIGRRSVEIRPIRSQRQETAWLQGDCAPCPGQYKGPATRHRVSLDQRSVKVDNVRTARRLDPQEVGGVKIYPVRSWSAYA